MIVKRLYDEKLAQASYLIGCAATGEALVVDANRDVDQYIRLAKAEGVRITHVTETHIHADYVSGSRELAQRTGATLHLSAEGGLEWQYGFAAADGAVLLRDGDRIRVGNIRVDVMHTPGHTPEHLSFLITDGAAADSPIAAVTGDFVFVGDVGRPDLLEKAAGVAGTMADSARTLYRSLQRFRDQPEWLQIWPGHGAGSACGKGLSAIPTSTVGYERRFNWAFSLPDEAAFVEAVLAGQPEPPRYFAEMKRINRDGPPILGGFRRPPELDAADLDRLLEKRAVVVDTRPAAEYAAGFTAGTISIPLNRSFNTWAGWLLPYDGDFYLIVDPAREGALDEAVRDLAMIGLDRVAGWISTSSLEGRATETIPQIDAAQLARMRDAGDVSVLDVRGRSEWEAGHLPGVPNIPVGYVAEHADELPRDGTLVLQCLSGGRSMIAASVLHARGFRNVVNLTGGFSAWQQAGLPVERPGQEEPLPAV